MKIKNQLYFSVILYSLLAFYFIIPGLYFTSSIKDTGFQVRETRQKDATAFGFSVENELLVLVQNVTGNVLNSQVKNWTEFFKYEIDQSFRGVIDQRKQKQDIFQLGYNILSSYIRNVQLSIIFLNLTYFVLINQTSIILETAFLSYSSNGNVSKAIDAAINDSLQILPKYPFGSLVIEQIKSWYNITKHTILSIIDGNYSNFSSFKNAFLNNVPSFQEILPSEMGIFADLVFTSFDFGQPLDAMTFYSFASSVLFGSNDTQIIEFLEETYASANLLYPIQYARTHLFEFINARMVPIGFNETIRNVFLRLYTDYNDPNEPIQKTVLRIPLNTSLSESEVREVVENMLKLPIISQGQKMGLDISLLTIYNLSDELNTRLELDISLIDVIALLAGFGLFVFMFRRIFLAFIVMAVNVFSLLITRGAISVFIFPLFPPTKIEALISNVLIFGASMNYSIFLVSRFLETKDRHLTSIANSMKDARNSILISSSAVVITLSPLMFSKIRFFQGLSILTISGLIIQVTLVLGSIPLTLIFLSGSLQFPSTIHKSRPHLFFINNPKKALLLIFILFLLSVAIIFHFPPKTTPTDFLSTKDPNSEVMATIYSDFKENIFSQISIKMESIVQLKFTNESLNLPVLRPLSNLSAQLLKVELVRQVLSPMWPYGTPVDLNESSSGFIVAGTAKIISSQYVNSNSTSLIITFQKVQNQLDIIPSINEIKSIVNSFVEKNKDFVFVEINGFLYEIAQSHEKVVNDIPIRLILSITLLSLFLGVIFRSFFFVPLRLLLSVIISVLLSLALTTILAHAFFSFSLNFNVFVFSAFILLAFAIDFDVYFYSRYLKELTQTPNDRALENAIVSSSYSIRSSGMLMIMSFSSLLFASIPVLVHSGLILVVSIFLDTFLLRSYIFPAFLALRMPTQSDRV